MTFKVSRALLRKALEAERVQLQKAHTKAVERYNREAAEFPKKLLGEIDLLRAKVAKGTIPVGYGNTVKCGLSSVPAKPKPDCRIADIDEMLRLLALSDDEKFALNDSSKFYRYACKL